MNFDQLFVNPTGRVPQADYIPALITVVAAILFFWFMVTGRTAQFCVLVLMYPLFVLLTQRVRDMGFPPWLVLIPAVLMVCSLLTLLGYFSMGETVDTVLFWIALLLAAAIAVWGCVSPGKS